jgi:hypothetical protein
MSFVSFVAQLSEYLTKLFRAALRRAAQQASRIAAMRALRTSSGILPGADAAAAIGPTSTAPAAAASRRSC